VVYEDLGRALGIEQVHVLPLGKTCAEFQQMLTEALASEKLVLIVARRPCVLAAKQIREYDKLAQTAACATCAPAPEGVAA
jgi:indolepyruvate ferredoxin oxidoreductase alpha subunit